jgi:antitoxin ParD1/3/4
MAQINISIPDKLKEWIEGRVADGSFASSSDYVRDLVRQDQRERQKLEWLRAEIERGRASGISSRSIEDIISQTRAQLQASGES